MYRAMADAELGDNVLETDPTVGRLESLAAEMTGMEAALFMPSGTMGNQCALATHTNPGDSVIFEDQAHMIWYEGGGPAIFSGVITRGLPTRDGTITPQQLSETVLTRSEHTPGTTLVCLENSHNRHGGAVTTVSQPAALKEAADEAGIRVHLDGARMFNASAALGVDIKEITGLVDTANFCLSKGLASPIGSLLCGPSDFITEAAFWRKRLGGGMRQAGILAACGIVSLTQMVERLTEDHERTQALSGHVAGLPGIDPVDAPTNILVMNTVRTAEEWMNELEKHGVRTLPFDKHRLRAVLHKDIGDAELKTALEGFSKSAEALA
jgi:threonine aldolase